MQVGAHDLADWRVQRDLRRGGAGGDELKKFFRELLWREGGEFPRTVSGLGRVPSSGRIGARFVVAFRGAGRDKTSKEDGKGRGTERAFRALTSERKYLFTSCFVMMPTAFLESVSTTTTQPIFSLTRESTTERNLSSGHAVTHLRAGIMQEATEGMCAAPSSEGTRRRCWGRLKSVRGLALPEVKRRNRRVSVSGCRFARGFDFSRSSLPTR